MRRDLAGFLFMIAAAGAAQGQTGRRQQIVAIDMSASRSARELTEAKRFAQRLIEDLRNGDRLELLQVHDAGLRDEAKYWSGDVPAAANPQAPRQSDHIRASRFQRTAKTNLSIFLDPAHAKGRLHTDIIATLYRVSDLMRAGQGRQATLYLLSDMLQSTPELNMEKVTPTSAWVNARAAEDRIPRISGLCVVVVGADISTAKGVAVRKFWLSYFSKAGAELSDRNYRNSAEAIADASC